MNIINDLAFRSLEAALTGLGRREQAIGSNIANVDTPGYTPTAVDFEAVLGAQIAAASGAPAARGTAPGTGLSVTDGLKRTDPRHLDSATAVVPFGASTTNHFAGSIRNDGNKTSVESEVTALAETQLRFAAVGRLLSAKINEIRTAIGGA